MSLLEELEARGVTAEDLEKAASVRLFEKAAAAEGVNLDDLDENQVEELYAHFVSNTMSDADNTKEASAMNDEIVDLFEKTAAAEGIDLDEMADDELAELYNHYVENVLPGQVEAFDGEKQASDEEVVFDMFQKTAAAEGLDLNEFNQYELQDLYGHYVENVLPLQLGDEDAADKVASAHEKLAEAEILGRHMARSYADEMDKLAGKGAGREIADRIADAAGYKRKSQVMERVREAGRTARRKAGEYGSAYMSAARGEMGRGRQAAAIGAPALLAAGGGAYAYKKRKGQEKKSSAFEEVEIDALMKIASEFGYEVAEKVAETGAIRAAGEAAYEAGKQLLTGSEFKRRNPGAGLISTAMGRGTKSRPDIEEARKILAARGVAGLGAAGFVGAGGKALHSRSKRNQEKRSSAYDYDDVVNEVALEMLADAGYDV
jgi:hypothetical protein